jgi:hypothetical protein
VMPATRTSCAGCKCSREANCAVAASFLVDELADEDM